MGDIEPVPVIQSGPFLPTSQINGDKIWLKLPSWESMRGTPLSPIHASMLSLELQLPVHSRENLSQQSDAPSPGHRKYRGPLSASLMKIQTVQDEPKCQENMRLWVIFLAVFDILLFSQKIFFLMGWGSGIQLQ